VDPLRFQVPADPPGLDVEVGRGAQRDRLDGALERDDRLVQADGGAHEGRELRVLAQVLGAQGLLDQQQVELVELRQLAGVAEPVRGVRVHLERHAVAEPLAHRPHRLDVPTGLDLELDPLVPLLEVPRDRVEQLVDRPEDPHRHPGWHPVPLHLEVRPERQPVLAQARVKHRHLQGGLRHPVPDDAPAQPRDVVRADLALAEQAWHEEVADHLVRAVVVLRGVDRLGEGDTLASALDVVGDRAALGG